LGWKFYKRTSLSSFIYDVPVSYKKKEKKNNSLIKSISEHHLRKKYFPKVILIRIELELGIRMKKVMK